MPATHEVRGRAARAAVTVVALVTVGACGSDSDSNETPTVEIEGVQTFSDLTQNHVAGTVDYPQTPPVGGDHAATWQNCGFYSTPIIPEQGVHSMEHGAVWITYDPALPAAEVATLQALAAAEPYLLVSPYPDLPAPVVASSWDKQLRLDGADDPRLADFVAAYAGGGPEAGGICYGGTTETRPTADDATAQPE